MRGVLLACLACVTAASPASGEAFVRTEQRADCAHHQPGRQVFFGDLHVHTTLSLDAWIQGTRNTPRDAYRFARGEAIGVQPYGEDGEPVRRVVLDRPLDFAMVSDHSELLGETQLCRTPGSTAYDRFVCVLLRRWPALGYMIVNTQWAEADGQRRRDICGEERAACGVAARSPWRAIQDAAEEAYDRSAACGFTPFVGYEWSGSRAGMIHRNVVFRNERVQEVPANAIDDGHDETRLWARLEAECRERSDGCDVLAIPHNSNVSLGSLFWSEGPGGIALTPQLAARRAALEPLIEITQHKGDSECRAGGRDELCSFETLPFGDLAGHASALVRDAGPPAGVYVREGLAEGLREQRRLGVNPYRLGIVGSTDSHLGTPGLVGEKAFVGHAAGTVSARLRIPALPDSPYFNPGGLAAVWAEENSRDSLFEAMRRRETFGTSGPRMQVRFFAGWDLGEDACAAPDFAAQGYARGVPMGGELTGAAAHGDAPVFAIQALRDPGGSTTPGAGLERIQIVKGWLEGGETRERVIDVARAPEAPPLDLSTCAPPEGGSDRLCATWRDPDFDRDQAAFYYARVVEIPTCRWLTHACVEAAVDCDGLASGVGPYAACCDPQFTRSVRERAWTSPIWYTPARPQLPDPDPAAR